MPLHLANATAVDWLYAERVVEGASEYIQELDALIASIAPIEMRLRYFTQAQALASVAAEECARLWLLLKGGGISISDEESHSGLAAAVSEAAASAARVGELLKAPPRDGTIGVEEIASFEAILAHMKSAEQDAILIRRSENSPAGLCEAPAAEVSGDDGNDGMGLDMTDLD